MNFFIQVCTFLYTNLNKLDSKITNKEAQILISRMMVEHKLNNVAKEHLFSLINCFLSQGK